VVEAEAPELVLLGERLVDAGPWAKKTGMGPLKVSPEVFLRMSSPS